MAHDDDNDPVGDLSDLELSALLDTTDNPWVFLDILKQHHVSVEQASPHQPRWMQLVRARPKLERESLFTAGSKPFGFSVKAAREHMKELEKDQPAGQILVAAVYTTADYLAEMVYRPGLTPTTGFLVHTFAEPEAPPAFHAQVIGADGRIVLPLGGAMVEQGVLHLPTQVEDYDDTTALFERVVAFIQERFYVPPPEHEAVYTLLAAYAMLTWLYDRFSALPYLRALGELDTGKTTLLEVVGLLCYRSLFCSSTTASPLFRFLDRVHGTLVIDEADFDIRGEMWGEIIKLLNAGNRRGFHVLRSERNGHDILEAAVYDCYGPKLLAGRHSFPDPALESRCFSYMTVQTDLPTTFKRNLTDEDRVLAQSLRNQLLYWRLQHWAHTTPSMDLAELGGLSSRSQQILLPALSCLPPGDLSARHRLITHARSLEYRLDDERRGTLEAQLLVAMWQSRVKAEKEGRWLVTQLTDAVNLGVPEKRQTDARTVGRRLTKLKFVSVWSPGNKAAYRFDLPRLQFQMRAYRLGHVTRQGATKVKEAGT